jgi:hypothetical protein
MSPPAKTSRLGRRSSPATTTCRHRVNDTVWRRLEAPLRRLYPWKSQHQYLGRYSVEKLCAFHEYQERTSLARVACVIAVSPLPVFFTLLALDEVPMNDPRKGPAANGVAFARSAIAHAVLPSMILLSTKQALQLSDRYYSIPHIARIGVCVSLALECVCISVAFLWRFPVPFREVTAVPLFAACVVFFNWHFGRDELRRKLAKLRRYLPMVSLQLSMFYSFLSLAVAFAYFSSATQIALVLVFPAIKLAVKRAVWSQAQRLDDLSTDVTICFVELTGALYQTVCLQFAKSQWLQYVILFSDLFQALYEVRAYLFHEYMTDGVSTVHTAVQIVLSGVFPAVPDDGASTISTKTGSRRRSLIPTSSAGGSVFLNPKKVRASASKRLLDLSQYTVQVDVPLPVGHPNPVRRGRTSSDFQGVEQLDGHSEARVEATAQSSSLLDPETSAMGPEILPRNPEDPETESDQARTHSSVVSPWSAEFSSPSQYAGRSTVRDDSAYGISRATAGSVSVASLCVSPAQDPEAATPPLPPPKSLVPPIRRRSSHLASLGSISLGCEQVAPSSTVLVSAPRPGQHTAFSVYDPTASSTPRLVPLRLVHQPSIVTALLDLEKKTSNPETVLVRRSSLGSFKPRLSARGSALVHPELALQDELPSGVETARGHTPDRDSLPTEPVVASPVARVMIDGIQVPRKDQARVLEQTLQLLFSCEVLLVVEFLEVLMPTLYGLVVGGLWPLYNARFNLLFIGMSYESMVAAVSGSLLYALLESLSLAVMAVVLKKRFGISALHLLAFVLETYWQVVYGKLVGSFLVVWLTLTVHQGTDFTFTFDYGVVLERFGVARFQ